MKLTGYEMETIILYNQAEPNAQVYTHDAKLIAKLRRLHEAAPEKVYADYDEPNGAARYIVPKNCVTVRPPYSDARRKADSERARRTGLTPPQRKIKE